MNKITQKLCSHRGASMILALVFLLFAIFVGGTVLASAAANGYRVAHLSDQQDYLDQRSAAMLIADELGDGLTLTITETVTTTKVAEGETTMATSITIKAPVNMSMTPLQRLMAETAIGQYLQQTYPETSPPEVILSGFGEGITRLEHLWLYTIDNGQIKISTEGTFTMNATSDLVEGKTVDFKCRGNEEQGKYLYDLVLDFGSDSSLIVTMDGYSGRNSPAVMTTENAEITTTQIAISWDAPVIEKGSVVVAGTEETTAPTAAGGET